MQRVACIFFLVFFSCIPFVRADCMAVNGKEAVERADLIFKGKSIETSQNWWAYLSFQGFNYYTSFTVEEVYKGNPAKKIDVFYHFYSGVSPTTSPLSVGEESIVFANKDSKTGKYMLSPCLGRVINMKMIREKKLNDATILTLVALVDRFLNIQDISFVDFVRSIEKEFVRETLSGYLFRHLLENGRTEDLEEELAEYDRNPQMFLCKNIDWVKSVFQNNLEKDVSCE